MNGCWPVPVGHQTFSYYASNPTIAACLAVEAPLKHTKDNIVVADYEALDLRTL